MSEPEPTAASCKAKARELSLRARDCMRAGQRDAAMRLVASASGWDLVAIECELAELRQEIRALAALIREKAG